MSGPPASAPAAADVGGAIIEIARSRAYDRYLAAKLAPPHARTALLALAAFDAEIARIPVAVAEPMLGEIRLQWWRDAIEAGRQGTRSGHPVADALAEAAGRFSLPRGLLVGMIDARAFELGGEPMPDQLTLRAYHAKTQGAMLVLAARALGSGHSGEVESAADAAGQALGWTRLLAELPQDLSRGHVYLPRPMLEAHAVETAALLSGTGGVGVGPLVAEGVAVARRHREEAVAAVARLARPLRLAFLPLAEVEAWLAAVTAAGRDPLRDLVELNPLGRVWRIWRAGIFGSF